MQMAPNMDSLKKMQRKLLISEPFAHVYEAHLGASWEVGETIDDAIGALTRKHPEEFGLLEVINSRDISKRKLMDKKIITKREFKDLYIAFLLGCGLATGTTANKAVGCLVKNYREKFELEFIVDKKSLWRKF
jgi:F0F1-type ATP synthase membrane subunit c/vacuolar-type H+-ATPase subunit K